MVEKLTQAAFLWDNFKVDVSLRFGKGGVFDAATSVCVLDFVLMLQTARITLREGSLAVLELFDRQDKWHFTRNKDMIRLRTRCATLKGWHFRPAEGHCPAREFDRLLEQSLADALALIYSRQPVTRQNPYLQALSSKVFDAA
ncbi:hypothetical protein [Streptomyces sp. gb14]|uniref:hypothetical protein n=1 Tax=Streptomyces sp. gb14 TaxID=1827753 RepID=UPI001C54D6A8|nr:hypothetical protein [Streptomyces sp. gb14]